MKKIILLIVISSAILFSTTGCQDYFNEKEVICTVQDKWVKRYSDDDVYLIQCDDVVYKITDLLWYGKFDSTDIYAKLKIGKKYKLSVSGYRWRFLSEYQNINDIEEVIESEENND